MRTERNSLLAGRNAEQLSEKEISNVTNTFLGLDPNSPFRYEPGGRTRFRVFQDEKGEEQCEIVFSADIFPGRSVIDPNSALGMPAAVAHELCHWHRYINKTEIEEDDLVEIDEALTSLEAVQRYPKNLNDHEVRQLVADAIQRLQIFAQRKSGR